MMIEPMIAAMRKMMEIKKATLNTLYLAVSHTPKNMFILIPIISRKVKKVKIFRFSVKDN